jgi:hypothetical protein
MRVVGSKPTKYVNEFGKEIEIPKDTAVIYELYRIAQDRNDSRQLKAIQIFMEYHAKVLNYIKMQEEIEKLELMFKYLTESGMPINEAIKTRILGNSLHNGKLLGDTEKQQEQEQQLPIEVIGEVTSKSQEKVIITEIAEPEEDEIDVEKVIELDE